MGVFCARLGCESTVEHLPGYIDDGACSVCGSLNADTFMARLEAGDVVLCPTDKNYKVYIHNKGGSPFKQTYGSKDKDGNHIWVCRDTDHSKFYFQHLSEEQKNRFVELLNEKKLHLDHPGYFYQTPFFVTYEGKDKPKV